jgi:hypothetical protein
MSKEIEKEEEGVTDGEGEGAMEGVEGEEAVPEDPTPVERAAAEGPVEGETEMKDVPPVGKKIRPSQSTMSGKEREESAKAEREKALFDARAAAREQRIGGLRESLSSQAPGAPPAAAAAGAPSATPFGGEEELEEAPEPEQEPMVGEAPSDAPIPGEAEMGDSDVDRKHELLEQMQVMWKAHIRENVGLDKWDELLSKVTDVANKFNELSLARNHRGQTLQMFLDKIPDIATDPNVMDNTDKFIKSITEQLKLRRRNAEDAANKTELTLQSLIEVLKPFADDPELSFRAFTQAVEEQNDEIDRRFIETLTEHQANLELYMANIVAVEVQLHEYSQMLQDFYNLVVTADGDDLMQKVSNDLEAANHDLERKLHEMNMARSEADEVAASMAKGPFSKGPGSEKTKRAAAGPDSVDPSIAAAEEYSEQPGTRTSEMPPPAQKEPPRKILAVPEPAGEGTYASTAADGYAGPYEPGTRTHLAYYPLPYGNLEFWSSNYHDSGAERKRPLYYARLAGTENFQKIKKSDIPTFYPQAPGEKVPRTKKNRFVEKWIQSTT